MKMKRNIFAAILFIGFGLQPVFSQTVKFELPAQKGKTLYLLACKGVERDTIFSGQIDKKGDLIFTPPQDKPLSAGVVSFNIKPDINFDFIYSPTENITFHCEDEYISPQNYQLTNSPENDFIKTHFVEQMQLREKIMFCDQGMQLYRENKKLYDPLSEEKKILEHQQTVFDNMLQEKSSQFYSARLMQLQNLMNNYVGRLQTTVDTTELARIRKYTLSNLDVEALYRSGMWFHTINNMLELYYKESAFYGQFGSDIATLLEKTPSQEPFFALANDAATICDQYGWNDDEAALSKYLILSGRVTNPQGKLRQILTIYKLQPGMSAPKIIGVNGDSLNFAKGKRTLVLFYESGCNNCENAINQLIGNYSVLEERGIEVVSIAADYDKDIFENTSRNFPWSTKLCDFKGFTGDNFNNYGIIGTPTFYMIDDQGIIQGKYAGLEEFLNILK